MAESSGSGIINIPQFQEFTLLIINSIVLLTLISSALTTVQPNSSTHVGVSKAKQALGFVSTIGAMSLTALVFTLSQLFFRKVIKKESFTAVLYMIIFQSQVASSAMVVGLFASKEWKGLSTEMEGYKLVKVWNVTTLVWLAIDCQVLQIGAVGLIFEVSSLFSNVFGALSLPVVQVLAVIIFHDKVDGVKLLSMVLAIWGLVSYMYKLYHDENESKPKTNGINAKLF